MRLDATLAPPTRVICARFKGPKDCQGPQVTSKPSNWKSFPNNSSPSQSTLTGSMVHPDSKKRKRTVVLHQDDRRDAVDTSKPTAIFQKPDIGRSNTLSIALPGSIIANAQSHDLKTSLAGRIARAAAVFCVDEIIIFDDGQSKTHQRNNQHYNDYSMDEQRDDGYTGYSDPDDFLFHLLSFLECPPYLRRHLFPLHPNLRTAGTLPSLDMPHHARSDEWCQYREGISLGFVQTGSHRDGTPRKKSKKEKANRATDDASLEKFANTTLVDAGFPVGIPVDIPPMTRVTLKFELEGPPEDFPYPREHYSDGGEQPRLIGEAVNPASPREDAGYYWGYSLRQASTLSAVFTECPFEDGYDVSIGTSERGKPTWDIISGSVAADKLPGTFSHALIVFGGVAGLEVAAAADKELASKGVGKDNLAELFDYYINVCPGQGSRTIRTEEAIWIALGQLRPWTEGAMNR